MFENLDDPQPAPYDGRNRAMVAARAAGLRGRARRLHRGVGAAVAVVVLVGVAAVLSERGAPVEVVAASDENSTTTSTAPVVADTTTTSPDTAPVTVVDATSVPATAPPPTEPPPPAVRCSSAGSFQPYTFPDNYLDRYDNARVEVHVALDRTVVAPGEGLTIILTVSNPTSEQINVLVDEVSALIRGESGEVFWYSHHDLGGTAGPAVIPGSERVIDANSSLDFHRPWLSEFCSNPESNPDVDPTFPFAPGRLAPGFYTMETSWFGRVNALTFKVR